VRWRSGERDAPFRALPRHEERGREDVPGGDQMPVGRGELPAGAVRADELDRPEEARPGDLRDGCAAESASSPAPRCSDSSATRSGMRSSISHSMFATTAAITSGCPENVLTVSQRYRSITSAIARLTTMPPAGSAAETRPFPTAMMSGVTPGWCWYANHFP